MKKLFLLLTAVLLCTGMGVQAQLLDAVNDSPEDGIISAKANLISERHNAPSVTNRRNVSSDYAECAAEWSDFNSSSSLSSGSTTEVYQYKWTNGGRSNGYPQLTLVLCMTKQSSYSKINNKNIPPYGVYDLSYGDAAAPGTGAASSGWKFTTSGSSYYCMYQGVKGGTKYYMYDGTVVVAEGANNQPYITLGARMMSLAGTKSTTYYLGYFLFTIGSPCSFTETFNSSDIVSSSQVYTEGSECIQQMIWNKSGSNPSVKLNFICNTSEKQTFNGKEYPPYGTYNINQEAEAYTLPTFPIEINGDDYTSTFNKSGINHGMESGTVQVVKGVGSPCIKINTKGTPALGMLYGYEDYDYYKTDYSYNITIGTAAYLITFKNYDGSTLQSSDFGEGSTPSYSGTPTKPDDASYTYTFSGWLPAIGKATADQVYTAQFSSSPKVTAVDVTLNPNGGSGNNQTVSATNGQAMPLTLKGSSTAINVPILTGYTFTGYWDTNLTTGGNQYYSYTGNPKALASARNWDKNQATTLYARWEANNYTATDNIINADATTAGQYNVYYDGTSIAYTTTPSKQGHTLEGLYKTYSEGTFSDKIVNSDGTLVSGTTTYTASGKWKYTSAPTLYANWSANSYTVTFGADANGGVTGAIKTSGTGITSSDPQSYGTVLTFTEDAAEGYEVDYWTSGGSKITGSDGHTSIDFTVTDNTTTNTIKAVYKKKVYTITWLDGNGNELTTTQVEHGSMPAYTGDTPTKSAINGYTYEFNNTWSPAFVAATAAANYTAQFNAVATTYTITYEGLNGAENSNPTSYNVESETITLAAPGARDGYRFTGWTDNDNSNAAVTQIIGGTYGDRHFTANWEETSYTVNVAVDEAGHGTVTADKDKVDEGGSVTVTYTPDSYSSINNETVEGFYEFVQWSDNNTDNPRTINPVNADINLTAVTRLKTTLTLRDDMPDDYYDDMAEAYYGNGTSPVTLTEVTCNRSFAANQWTVFSLPFGLDLDALENSQLDGKVYHYIGATGNADEGLNVNFEHETDEIIAGMPYLFYSPSVVKDPVFSNVTLNDALVDTDNDKQAGYTTGKTGNVRFIATNRIKSLPGGDKSVIFLSKSRLYYPNAAGNKLRPFRGFFKVPAEQHGVTPRLRIVADGQTVTEIEAVVENGQQATVRKYIENGTLVIEREGVRYDATGAKIN